MAIKLGPGGLQSYDPSNAGKLVLNPKPIATVGPRGKGGNNSGVNMAAVQAAEQAARDAAAKQAAEQAARDAAAKEAARETEARMAEIQAAAANSRQRSTGYQILQAREEIKPEIPIRSAGYEILRERGEITPEMEIATEKATAKQKYGVDLIYDSSGSVTGVQADLGYGMRSYSLDNYNSEVDRINRLLPKEKFYNPRDGKIYDKSQDILTKNGKVFGTSTPIKIYVDPKTGKPIQDLNSYLIENRLPSGSPSKIKNAADFRNFLNEKKTYDLSNIPSFYKQKEEKIFKVFQLNKKQQDSIKSNARRSPELWKRYLLSLATPGKFSRFLLNQPIIQELSSFPGEMAISLAKGHLKVDYYLKSQERLLADLIRQKAGLKYLPRLPRFKMSSSITENAKTIMSLVKIKEKDQNDLIEKVLSYDRNSPIYTDPDVQNWAITVGLSGIGAAGRIGAVLGKTAYAGFTLYGGYQTIKNPSAKNIAALTWLVAPAVIQQGIVRFSKGGAYGNKFQGYKPGEVPERFRTEYKDYYRAAQEIMRWRPRNVNVDLKEVASLKGDIRLASLIKRSLSKTGDILGGTGGISSSVNMKRVNDIDLYSSAPEKSAAVWENIFRKNGIKYSREGNAFYIGKDKIMEINSTDLLLNTQRTINGRLSQPAYIKTADGINVADPRYLIIRKWLGGFERGTEKGSKPLYRYSKDLPRYIEAARQVLVERGESIKKLPIILRQFSEFKFGRAEDYLEPYKYLEKQVKAVPVPDRYIWKVKRGELGKIAQEKLAAFEKAGMSLAKIKKYFGKVEYNKLQGIRKELAAYIFKEKGYLGGSTAIELQLPEGTFRKGRDLDAYFQQISESKMKRMANNLKRIGEKYLGKGNIEIVQKEKHIALRSKKTGEELVDLGTRGETRDRIIQKGSYRLRKLNQIEADKREILKRVDPREPKYEKAKRDLKLIEKAKKKIIVNTTNKVLQVNMRPNWFTAGLSHVEVGNIMPPGKRAAIGRIEEKSQYKMYEVERPGYFPKAYNIKYDSSGRPIFVKYLMPGGKYLTRKYNPKEIKKYTSKYFNPGKYPKRELAKYPTRYPKKVQSERYPSQYPSNYQKKPGRYPSQYPKTYPKANPRVFPRESSRIILTRGIGRSQKISSKKAYFDVFAKPIKSASIRKRVTFIKVNKRPLKKSEAEDLRDYILDTSLSRTGFIKKSKNIPGKIKQDIKFPRGYAEKTARKFRNYRIVRRRRVPLPEGMVIERRRNILDTRQEKEHIDLIRRIKQLQIKSTKKNINRPGRLIKGSLAAKNFMAKLRNMRK